MARRGRRERERFLLVSVSTAGGPASLRVQVWRKLRSLGALYVQQSVCLLPDRERPSREVARLLARVHAQGGAGRVLTIEVPDERECAALVAEFNAARDVEYGEVVERTPAMLAEIEAETAHGRATYAEVEESEADLNRFRTWLAKIVARDYFDAPGRAAAEEAVARCAQALAEFEAAALSADTDITGGGTGTGVGAGARIAMDAEATTGVDRDTGQGVARGRRLSLVDGHPADRQVGDGS